MFSIKFHFYRDEFKWYDLRNLIVKPIRVVTNSIYNHVAIEMNRIIYQSQSFKGVWAISESFYDRKPAKTIEIKVTENVFYDVKKRITNELGKDYDYKCAIGFLGGKPLHKKDRWFCSELANLAFYDIIEGFYEESQTLISPKDLYNRVLFYKKGLEKCKHSGNHWQKL